MAGGFRHLSVSASRLDSVIEDASGWMCVCVRACHSVCACACVCARARAFMLSVCVVLYVCVCGIV